MEKSRKFKLYGDISASVASFSIPMSTFLYVNHSELASLAVFIVFMISVSAYLTIKKHHDIALSEREADIYLDAYKRGYRKGVEKDGQ